MTAHEQREFRARMSGLDDALEFVEAFGVANGMATDDALRLRLIVEELFTNSVEHGHGGDSDSPIGLTLEADGRQVRLVYEDTAAPFDPLRHQQADAPPDELRVGGLGLHLVASLAAHIDYAREGGRNRLRLVLARRG